MSAEAFVEQIISQALSIAADKSQAADSYSGQAIAASQGYSTLAAPTINFTPAVIEPPVNIPSTATGLDTALYDDKYSQIITDLSDQFEQFFDDYFPANDAAMAAAQSWLTRALTTGGTGLSSSVEAQIVARDRARVQRDAQRASEAVMETFAARGFPLPPGAAVHAVTVANQQAAELSAQSSRDIAIKQMELEIENVRFAVQQVINERVSSIQAAGDYIRTLAIGPEIAARLATSSADAQARLISAATGYYSARIRVEELRYDVAKTNAGNTLDAGKTNVGAFMERVRNNTNAVVSVAASLGSQSGAALNAVHASAGVQVQTEAE